MAAETFRFQVCRQLDSEPAADFANRLKRLAATCEFGAHLSRALRDQFVCELRNCSLTKKLLVDDKSFADMLSIGVADEPAEKCLLL